MALDPKASTSTPAPAPQIDCDRQALITTVDYFQDVLDIPLGKLVVRSKKPERGELWGEKKGRKASEFDKIDTASLWKNKTTGKDKGDNFCGIFFVVPKNLLVIDVDLYKAEGQKSWNKLQKDFPTLMDGQAPLFQVRTASGGLHLYYNVPEDGATRLIAKLKLNKNLKTYEGIDFLSQGSICTLPNTISGTKSPDIEYAYYKPQNDLEVLNMSDRAVAPLELLNRLAGDRRRFQSPASVKLTEEERAGLEEFYRKSPYEEAIHYRYFEAYVNCNRLKVRKGVRNTTFFHFACIGRERELRQSLVEKVLQAFNKTLAPSLEEYEVRQTCVSAYSYTHASVKEAVQENKLDAENEAKLDEENEAKLDGTTGDISLKMSKPEELPNEEEQIEDLWEKSLREGYANMSQKQIVKLKGKARQMSADEMMDNSYDIPKTSTGLISPTTANFKRLITCSEQFNDNIAFDIFENALVWLKFLPSWKSKACELNRLESNIIKEESDVREYLAVQTREDRKIRDRDVAEIVEVLEETGFSSQKLNDKTVKTCLLSIAESKRVHLISEAFKHLPKWDNVPRVDNIASSYFTLAPSTPEKYANQVLELLFKGIMARVFNASEGKATKFEYFPLLVGKQGARKSTFWRVLSLSDTLFTDGVGSLRTPKEYIPNITGKLICEDAELVSLTSLPVPARKSFLSATTDRTRIYYSQESADTIRTALFVGTSNNVSFPSDITGERRIKVMTIEKTIDIEKFAGNIEQIYAEAKHKYETQWRGEPISYDTDRLFVRSSAEARKPYEIKTLVETNFLRYVLSDIGVSKYIGQRGFDFTELCLACSFEGNRSKVDVEVSNILLKYGFECRNQKMSRKAPAVEMYIYRLPPMKPADMTADDREDAETERLGMFYPAFKDPDELDAEVKRNNIRDNKKIRQLFEKLYTKEEVARAVWEIDDLI